MAVFYFDGDQTLWDFQAMMRRAMSATIVELQRLRPEVEGDLSVETFISDREVIVERLRGRTANLEQVRFEAFRHSLARLEIPDDALAARLNSFYLERRFAGVELYEDVMPVLAELRSSHRVGLLSNGNSYPHRLGLEGLFQATVLSQDHGLEKPDRRIFEVAAERLPGEPRIMVGDSLRNDVQGAQSAGWTGIWLNRDGAPVPTDAAPDLIVTSLRDLLEFARSL